MPLSENQLVVPALIAMIKGDQGYISTSALIDEIANQFSLDSEDVRPLINRNDEKYTQIVRNLKSHKTFVKNGYATEENEGFRITPEGATFLEDNGFI
ncbi:hypothetical protein HCX49_01900 [Sphingobacterium kitahiroshimense]|uniref:hypothetical protein n=1 Tax=Sphingobacterium sp. B16(2022) TaxID=2914044 RepID=UPI00143A4D90|nr:hypothetical protein [Sphingobacterium sp. B16(2022)]NJI71949.1 hypothetical protein [Sphingobacterium sp. B16(2022)]